MAERKKPSGKGKIPLKRPRSKTTAKVVKVDGKSPIPGKFDAAMKKAFLQALFDGMTVGKACALIGISRPAVYKRRDNDPGFSDEWDEAQRMGHAERCDVVRDTMWTRAVTGYKETEVRQYKSPDGKTRSATKLITKVDNTLLLALAKSLMPEEFKDRVNVDKTIDVGEALAELMEKAHQSPQNSIGSLVK